MMNKLVFRFLVNKLLKCDLAVVLLTMAGMATIVDSSLRALSTDVNLNQNNDNNRLLETKQANTLPTSSSSKTLPPFSSDILEGYQSCDDFKSDVVKFLTVSGQNFIESQKNSWCYYNDTITYYNSSIDIPYSQGSRRAQKKETSYGTNNQVANVQEKELIQSDGKYIYAASRGTILVSNLNGKVVANVTIPSPPLTSVKLSSYVTLDAIFINNSTLTAFATTEICDLDAYYYGSCNSTYTAFYYNFNQKTKKMTLVKQVDVSSLSFNEIDARQIGDYTYLLARAYFGDLYVPLSRCNETLNDLSSEEYEVAALVYLSSNVNQYASKIVAKLAKEGATTTCNNIIKLFNETVQQYDVTFGITKIFSLGLSSTSKKAYFFPFLSSETYISKDAILVSTQGYFGVTVLLKFSLKDADLTPSSVGSLDGWIFSPYGIDHYNGYYRIASSSSSTFEAQVTVFQEQNSQLKVAGRVTAGAGLMQSVRFHKEKGFLVTTDWIGVYYNESTTTMNLLNLTFPTNPSIAATEIITHPLNYNMYPIEDGKYIIYIDDFVSVANASGITVYLFQATNNSLKHVGKPSEVISTQQANGYFTSVSSDAMLDSHAFRYLSQSRKLIIPATVYEYTFYNVSKDVNDENFQGLINVTDSFLGFYAYDVDLANGVKYVGNVTHDVASHCYYYPSRSMVFNGDLITVMGSTIKRTSSVTTLSNLKWELESNCAYS